MIIGGSMGTIEKLLFTDDDLLVTNTYPAFIKACKENSNGNYLAQELRSLRRSDFNNSISFASDFYNRLNQLILDNYHKKTFKILKSYKGGQELLTDILNDRFELLLLRTKTHLIFLNFKKIYNLSSIKTNDYTNIFNLDDLKLIPSINNYNIHVRELKQKSKSYLVTNTYNSFLSYVDLNNLNTIKSSNEPFFKSFTLSLGNRNLNSSNKSERKAKETYKTFSEEQFVDTDCEYTYVIADDVVIIVDYTFVGDKYLKVG